MSEKDIAGVEMTVEESKGGNFDIPDLDEDLVYPAVLVEVKEDSFTYQGELKEVIKWIFELTDEEHQYEVEQEDNTNETRRRKVTGTTSKICTPKSKMYNWYTKIMGEVPEGSIKLGDLYDIPCNLIIKNKKGKAKKEGGKAPVYANVDRIMTVKGAKKKEKVSVKKTEKKKNLTQSAKKSTVKKIEKIDNTKTQEDSGEVESFSDIF